MTTVKKTVQKLFRLSVEEAAVLSQKAKATGISESAYLRLMIRQKPNDYPEIRLLLRELINEVNHIGVNVNQIVKNNNSNFYLPEDKEHLMAYMKKLNRVVKEAVVQIGDQ